MTTFRLCHQNALLLLSFLAGWSVTTAWVTPPTINNACSTTSRPTTTTSLAMFDWFNPKPKTSTKEEKKSDDFLSNMFNQGSPPVEEKKEEAPPAPAAVEPLDEVKAVVTVDEKAKSEPTVVAATETPKAPAKEDAKPVDAAKEEVHSGVVSWFNRLKGFGFIKASDGSSEADVFVHQSEIQAEGYRHLVDGEHVEYVLKHDANGRPRAVQVTGPNGGDLRMTVKRKERKAAAKEGNN